MANPSLSTKQINQIGKLIKNWNNEFKFTWETLVLHVDAHLNIRTTRQTLTTYPSIKLAYDKKKNDLRKSKGTLSKPVSKYVDTSASKVRRLENEKNYLQEKLDAQLTFIKRVAQHAQTNPAFLEILQKAKQNL